MKKFIQKKNRKKTSFNVQSINQSMGDMVRDQSIFTSTRVWNGKIIEIDSLDQIFVRKFWKWSVLRSIFKFMLADNLNGSTLTLPTKSSTGRSSATGSRPSLTSSSTLNNSGGKMSSHHMSTESLQSSATLNHRQPPMITGAYALRNSPSMDRLATPRTSMSSSGGGGGGNMTSRTYMNNSSPASSVKSTPMRKWTSNSDFQSGGQSNGNSASNNTLPSPGHS